MPRPCLILPAEIHPDPDIPPRLQAVDAQIADLEQQLAALREAAYPLRRCLLEVRYRDRLLRRSQALHHRWPDGPWVRWRADEESMPSERIALLVGAGARQRKVCWDPEEDQCDATVYADGPERWVQREWGYLGAPGIWEEVCLSQGTDVRICMAREVAPTRSTEEREGASMDADAE